MEVKFLNLSYSTNQIKDQYLKKAENILDKANYILTDEVEEFEKEYAKMMGTKYCAGLSSGADALYLGLVTCGVKKGDEVIIQGNAYNASVTSILRVGAVPVFVDIDQKSMCIDIEKIEGAITDKTIAIMPVHLYGYPNDMETICNIAKKHNLKIIEDTAQAHLSEFHGKKLGTWGDVGAFSFYPTKNLGAFGDAGAIVTDDKEIYEKVLAMRNLGQINKNDHKYFGLNMRLDPIQAVCLSLKLEYLEENTKLRQKAGKYYDQLFSQHDLPIITPITSEDNIHVYHLYVIQLQGVDRDNLQSKLLEKGIQSAVHYPVPVFKQPFFWGQCNNCPISVEVSNNILSLPLHESIAEKEQEYVVASIVEIINKV